MAKQAKTVVEFDFNAIEEEKEENSSEIIKRKKIEIKPMSEEEAILQMELIGHQFYMYKDSETSKVAVIYKRKDEGYGIIETE